MFNICHNRGERARFEFRKSDMLKFVAKVYDKPVTAFRDQYEEILMEEGDDVFDVPDVEPQKGTEKDQEENMETE